MTTVEIFLTGAFIVNLLLGVGVFFTNRKRTLNQSYLTAAVLIAVWLVLNRQILSEDEPQQIIRFIRMATIVATMLPVSSHIMRLSILHPHENLFRVLLRAKHQLLLLLITTAACLSPWFIQTVTMPDTASDVPNPVYGWAYFIFAASFVALSVSLLVLFVKDRKRLTGLQVIELDFIAMGSAVALGTGITCGVLITLLTSSSQTVPMANAASILSFTSIISYGIATKRILDIATIARRFMALLLLVIYLIILYMTVWHGIDFLLLRFSLESEWFAQIIASLAVAFTMAPIHGRLQYFASKLSGSKSLNVPAMMKEAGDFFQSMSTMNDLLNHFSRLLSDSFGTDHVRILTLKENTFHQEYPTGYEPLDIALDDPLVKLLRKEGEPVSLDNLLRSRQTRNVVCSSEKLDSLDSTIAIGIFSKHQLIGILLLGERLNGHIYSRTDQDALQLLCSQLAVALENAHMYTAMQDSKIRNEIMLDQLVSGVIVAGPDHRITLFNHEAQRITGIPEDEAIGMHIMVLPTPIFQALDHTLKHMAGSRNIDASLTYEETESIITMVRMATSFLFGYDGNPMGALLVFTDISELKGLEEQVRRSDQLSSVGTLAAGMAHEIKNPLVTVKTFTQLLPKRYDDEDFRNEFSSLVAHEVARIDSIVNELLSFSKPAKPNLIPMKLQDILEQTLKLTQEQMLQKNITLKKEYDAESDLIFGDAKLLSQALVNLNLNAIEAIGKDGTITVSATNCTYLFAGELPGTSRARRSIRLQITDTGAGIKRENLQKIFDPFFTSKSEGTGMGLSVAHGIINEHGGAIEVDSSVNRGTTFQIYLPLQHKEEDPA